jgi:hypothetical protein
MIVALALPVAAADLANDPKGFDGIAWGVPLDGRPGFERVENAGRIKTYERRGGSFTIGRSQVDSIRYVEIDGQFARVMVRYRGKATHDAVLADLQAQHGPSDYGQGQMIRGLNQQFNWRGTDTEINLNYESRREQGYLFYDSRALAPLFNDHVGD